MLKAILEEHNMSLYKLEKLSNISHATLSDLANEKTNPNNCSSLLLNKISKTLDISMDDLFARLTYENLSSIDFDKNFDLFKSNVDQEFKRIKPIGFIKKYANNGEIKRLFDEKKYPHSFYLIALLDYSCKKIHMPLFLEYDMIRRQKLDKILVPESIYRLLEYKQMTLNDALSHSIPEFLAYNIVEADIEDVI